MDIHFRMKLFRTRNPAIGSRMLIWTSQPDVWSSTMGAGFSGKFGEPRSVRRVEVLGQYLTTLQVTNSVTSSRETVKDDDGSESKTHPCTLLETLLQGKKCLVIFAIPFHSLRGRENVRPCPTHVGAGVRRESRLDM